MKLPLRIAGLCWSAAFLVTAIPGFYQQAMPGDLTSISFSQETLSGMNILETLGISIAGAMAAGLLGYMIGDILSHPQGGQKSKKSASGKAVVSVPEEAKPATPTDDGDDVDLPLADINYMPEPEPVGGEVLAESKSPES